jgi:uracil-DNA glycosylase family 4
MRKQRALGHLCRHIKACCHCSLHESTAQALCGEGNADASLFFIAQAPGETEEKVGHMFMGPTGRVVDQLFQSVHLSREEVYMTNLIKCRLPGNRKPKMVEIESCGFYLDREIEIVKPRLLVPMGYCATRYLLERYGLTHTPAKEQIGRLYVSGSFLIYPVRHPFALLHNPSLREELFRDFERIPHLCGGALNLPDHISH